jgi:hypothetical protein
MTIECVIESACTGTLLDLHAYLHWQRHSFISADRATRQDADVNNQLGDEKV